MKIFNMKSNKQIMQKKKNVQKAGIMVPVTPRTYGSKTQLHISLEYISHKIMPKTRFYTLALLHIQLSQCLLVEHRTQY